MISEIYERGLVEVALLSGVPLGAGCITGMAVSLLQAVTQIGDTSTAFCVRYVTVAATILVFGSAFLERLIELVQSALSELPVL